MKDHSFETLNRFCYSQQWLGNIRAHPDQKPMGLKRLVFWIISNKKFEDVKLECLLSFEVLSHFSMKQIIRVKLIFSTLQLCSSTFYVIFKFFLQFIIVQIDLTCFKNQFLSMRIISVVTKVSGVLKAFIKVVKVFSSSEVPWKYNRGITYV